MRKVIQLIAISFIYYEQNDKIAWKRVNSIKWHKQASIRLTIMTCCWVLSVILQGYILYINKSQYLESKE